MSSIENRSFNALEVGEEVRLVHTLSSEDFSLLATQAATIGAGIVDPTIVATRAFSSDAAQNGWGAALLNALIAGRLPGAGSKLVRQTVETMTAAQPGDVMTIAAKVMAKTLEGRRVTIEVRATNQHGEMAMAASAEIVAPKTTVAAEPRAEFVEQMREKGRRYKILIEATRDMKPLKTAVVHPVDIASLTGAIEAARADLMEPILVGPEAKIRRAAEAGNIDIAGYPIVSTEHSHAAADKAVAMARVGRGRSADEGRPSHRRTDASGGCDRYRSPHGAADQPRVRHRRAGLSEAPLHHRRGGHHLSDPAGQARHRPERHRPRASRSAS